MMLMPQLSALESLIEPHSWLASALQSAREYHGDYVGRFAPSPSGLLHQGSLIAALASYLHAHWHGGQWLVRMEDVDRMRCKAHYGLHQIQTLTQLGFVFASPVWQSQRESLYLQVFEQLRQKGWVYPCTCTRKQVLGVYSGQCRQGHEPSLPIRSWRLNVGIGSSKQPLTWHDAFMGVQSQDVCSEVGDYPLQRMMEGQIEWTYQMAVVVDDQLQGVTHVIRGADLLDSTARQIALQQLLGYHTPQYSHFNVLLGAAGEKLSKSGQAPALDALHGLDALMHAWQFLGGRPMAVSNLEDFWSIVLVHPK